MKLLTRAVTVLILVCSLLVASVAVGARLNPPPTTTQKLGFEMCDGVPCFRGITPGMGWALVRRWLPSAFVNDRGGLTLPLPGTDADVVEMFPTDDKQSVAIFALDRASGDPLHKLPITAGELISRYGTPCRAHLYYTDGVPATVLFVYPGLLAFVEAAIWKDPDSYYPADYRLLPESNVDEFWITDKSGYTCDQPFSSFTSQWRGFTSPFIYLDRNQRDYEPQEQ